jgi:hypothetical protein
MGVLQAGARCSTIRWQNIERRDRTRCKRCGRIGFAPIRSNNMSLCSTGGIVDPHIHVAVALVAHARGTSLRLTCGAGGGVENFTYRRSDIRRADVANILDSSLSPSGSCLLSDVAHIGDSSRVGISIIRQGPRRAEATSAGAAKREKTRPKTSRSTDHEQAIRMRRVVRWIRPLEADELDGSIRLSMAFWFRSWVNPGMGGSNS